jgi:branched-chain amino acid transport system substrate-binding protein
MRSTTRLLLTATAALTMAAPALAADLKIGLSVSLSGPNSSIGVPYSNGMKAAVAMVPEIAGRKVRLIVLDDGSDPSASGRNARKLVDDEKVDVLMGASGVPAALAISQVGWENKTPMVGLVPMQPPADKSDWTVTVAQPPEMMISAVVDKMKQNGVKSVAYIGYSDAWGDLVYKALMQSTEKAGIKVVTNERFTRDDQSVAGQVLRIMAAKPDAVMTGGGGTPGALPYLALRERGYKGGLYGQHALVNPDFLRVAGTAADGCLVPTGPVIVADQLPDGNPIKKASQDFRASYLKVIGSPSSDAFSAYSFDGFRVFADAAARALAGGKAEPGTPQFRQALRDAIFTTKEVVGSHGVYSFKAGGLYGVDDRARVVVKVDNGTWKLVN